MNCLRKLTILKRLTGSSLLCRSIACNEYNPDVWCSCHSNSDSHNCFSLHRDVNKNCFSKTFNPIMTELTNNVLNAHAIIPPDTIQRECWSKYLWTVSSGWLKQASRSKNGKAIKSSLYTTSTWDKEECLGLGSLLRSTWSMNLNIGATGILRRDKKGNQSNEIVTHFGCEVV